MSFLFRVFILVRRLVFHYWYISLIANTFWSLCTHNADSIRDLTSLGNLPGTDFYRECRYCPLFSKYGAILQT